MNLMLKTNKAICTIKKMNNFQKITDEVWNDVVREAKATAVAEPALAPLLEDVVLSCNDIFESIAIRITRKLGHNAVAETDIFGIFREAFNADEKIRRNIIADIIAIRERDPACSSYLHPIMYFKGFHSITSHRVAHHLWEKNRKHLAYYIQSLCSEIFAVDIHPAAKFGGGILLDHATSFVAGETSVVEDNVSILHEVTLGGTGNEVGDRHPKVRSGVLIGAGSKLIGNIEIGRGAKIGAGSVVLDDVPEHTTVVGVPAKPVGTTTEENPAGAMNQNVVCFEIKSEHMFDI